MDAPRVEGEHERPWSALRRELEAEGVRPTKTLGQNFLYDPNLARAIVRDARVVAGDRVLEVGPGCGFLTVPLADAGVDLLAVEIDPRLMRVAQRAVGERDNVRFLRTDVLDGKHALSARVHEALWTEGDWHLVANLPYAISGPLVALLACGSNPPRSMTMLVQNEMAERFAAEPGTGAFGALTVRVRLRYEATLGRTVGAQLFWPKPRVASRIVRLERANRTDITPDELGRLDALVDGLFQRRRKTLLSSLSVLLAARPVAAAALARAQIDPKGRPETLTPEDFVRLVRALPDRSGGAPMDGDGTGAHRA